jgi:hypothetical protein
MMATRFLEDLEGLVLDRHARDGNGIAKLRFPVPAPFQFRPEERH